MPTEAPAPFGIPRPEGVRVVPKWVQDYVPEPHDIARPAIEILEIRGSPTTFAPGYLSYLAGRAALAPRPTGYTPTQVRHAHGFDRIAFNGVAGDGSGQTIAIADASDDASIASDAGRRAAAADHRAAHAAVQHPLGPRRLAVLPAADRPHGPDKLHYLGEDWAFSYRLEKIGVTPLADTSIRLWHWGRYGFSWEDAGHEVSRYRSYSYRFQPT